MSRMRSSPSRRTLRKASPERRTGLRPGRIVGVVRLPVQIEADVSRHSIAKLDDLGAHGEAGGAQLLLVEFERGLREAVQRLRPVFLAVVDAAPPVRAEGGRK